MSAFEALILGILQGLTEFLPVSSSGHLELGTYLLGIKNSNNLLFAIIVHGATALSTLVVFRKDIYEIIKGLLKFEWNESTKFSLKIILSMIPVGIIGILFEEKIEALFTGNILFVASMLAVTGLLLLLTHFSKPQTGEVTIFKSIMIGIAQAMAILPGISRSGATISTALLLGIDRTKAAKFSFLMVLPPILGATLLKFLDFLESPEIADGISTLSLSVGFIAAFISGLLACTWMIKIVQKGKLIHFAYYCFIISGFVLIYTLF
jgi:undecaprenyl-diphosphatase